MYCIANSIHFLTAQLLVHILYIFYDLWNIYSKYLINITMVRSSLVFITVVSICI